MIKYQYILENMNKRLRTYINIRAKITDGTNKIAINNIKNEYVIVIANGNKMTPINNINVVVYIKKMFT